MTILDFQSPLQAELPRTYISQDQAGPWCTQLQILDLHVLELNPLNFHLFFLLFSF